MTDRQRVPRVIPWLGMLLSVAGIGVSTYLTIAHYTAKIVLACPETGIINCAKVTSSSYSEILGIPVALLGLVFFIGMLPLQTPWAWRIGSKLMNYGRLVFAGTGVLFILWFVYVELYRLDAICLYCTSVHVLTVLIFFTTIFGLALSEPIGTQNRQL